MMTVTDLARELGISVPQARRRLEALLRYLNGELDGKVARGSRGKILVAASVAEMLRQVERVARDRGITFSAALQMMVGSRARVAETSREDPVTVAGRPENPDQAQIVARAIISSVLGGAGLIAIAIILASLIVALLR